MGLLLLFFFLAIGISFLCSILEAVLLSITPAYVNIKKQEGGKLAKDLEKFKADIDRPLSAILTMNTIAHTVGAIGVGAQAGKVFGHGGFQVLNYTISAEMIIATVMTLAVLILSEIIPKTIGANFWKSLVPFSVTTIKLIMIPLKPLIWVSQLITGSMKSEHGKSVLSRSDFVAMAKAVSSKGVLKEDESRIIHNLLKFNSINVHDVMTPRTVISAAEEDTTLQEYYDTNKILRYSRIPLYNDQLDNISGYMLKDDLLNELAQGHGEKKLKDIKRNIEIVNEETSIADLLKAMTKRKEHIALVVDEYGGVDGIITQEDIIETLLGLEIMDEVDNYADMRDLAQRKWKNKSKDLDIQ